MKNIFFVLLMAFSFTSCMEEADIWDSSVKDLSGNWWVRTYNEDGTLAADYSPMITYNTAEDNGDMWVNCTSVLKIGDTQKVETLNLTFEGENISAGKVFKEAGFSKTGIPTDSIYMTVVNEGITYTVAGHKKTGFTEDEY